GSAPVAARPAPPGLVHRLRPGRRPDDRGRGRGRARRFRLQHRGADRARGDGRLDPETLAATGGAGRRPAGGVVRQRRGPRAMSAILRWLFDLDVRLLRTLDWQLCAALFALMGIGLAVLYSAGGESRSLVVAQAARYAVGFGALWALSRIQPHRLRNATPAAYVLTIVPLLLVLAIGTGRHGRHWIDL